MDFGLVPDGTGVVAIATVIAVTVGVTLHYETLRILTDRVAMPRHHHRERVIFMILCLLMLHVVEIWVFGVAYFVLLRYFEVGELIGMDTVNLFDCVYHSAMSYTTIGFGDIVPEGAIRLLTGMQGVCGLVLITWSASYTFLVMQRTWNLHD